MKYGWMLICFCVALTVYEAAAGGTPAKTTGPGLSCVICHQIGTRGTCARSTLKTRCPAGSTHCKAKVSYYHSPVEKSGSSSSYRLASVVRECATESVVTQCLTDDVANSNSQHVSCQESCQTSGCNTGWPARPKCSQCDATNRKYSIRQFENCRTRPYQPRQCSSPVFAYCTTILNNTASDPDFPRTVKRGCSINDIGTRCYDIPASGGRTINHCQASCNTDGCNEYPLL